MTWLELKKMARDFACNRHSLQKLVTRNCLGPPAPHTPARIPTPVQAHPSPRARRAFASLVPSPPNHALMLPRARRVRQSTPSVRRVRAGGWGFDKSASLSPQSVISHIFMHSCRARKMHAPSTVASASWAAASTPPLCEPRGCCDLVSPRCCGCAGGCAGGCAAARACRASRCDSCCCRLCCAQRATRASCS